MADTLNIKRTADFSPCRKYRYTLVRRWDDSKPACLFILLNPSTADEIHDDPTNRRGIGYARAWGYGSVVFCNLFAFRTPYPRELKEEPDPIGPDNKHWITKESTWADLVIAAWGTNGDYMDMGKIVLRWLEGHTLHHLGLTKAGHPKHILYLSKNLKPQCWRGYEKGKRYGSDH